jgi:hypothetical protein
MGAKSGKGMLGKDIRRGYVQIKEALFGGFRSSVDICMEVPKYFVY